MHIDSLNLPIQNMYLHFDKDLNSLKQIFLIKNIIFIPIKQLITILQHLKIKILKNIANKTNHIIKNTYNFDKMLLDNHFDINNMGQLSLLSINLSFGK